MVGRVGKKGQRGEKEKSKWVDRRQGERGGETGRTEGETGRRKREEGRFGREGKKGVKGGGSERRKVAWDPRRGEEGIINTLQNYKKEQLPTQSVWELRERKVEIVQVGWGGEKRRERVG